MPDTAVTAAATRPVTDVLYLLPPGLVIDRRYRLTSHLASGGMGDVYCAEQLFMKRNVALKVLRREISEDPGATALFEREVQLIAQLDHPHIVRVYDCGRTEAGLLYLAMELVDGASLDHELNHIGLMQPARAVAILQQLCMALGAAHDRGIIHRDVKPENTLLLHRPANEPDFAKMLDFGVARPAHSVFPDVPVAAVRSDGPASRFTSGRVMGTPQYMSPEQAMARPVDVRSDVYALGVTAYRMLCDRLPFQGSFGEMLAAHVSAAPRPMIEVAPGLARYAKLCEVVHRAMEKDPANRWQTTAAFSAALEEALAEAVPRSRTLPATHRSVPASLARRTVFIHRTGVLDGFLEAAGNVESGGAATRLLIGEPGSGRSRWLQEVAETLRQRAWNTMLCRPSGIPLPLASAASLVTGAAVAAGGQSTLLESLQSLGLPRADVGVLRAVARDRAEPPELTPHIIATSLQALLEQIAAKKPTFLVIEDLPQHDPESGAVFATLATLQPNRVFIAGTSTERSWSGISIPIAPLPPDDAVRFAMTLLSGRALPLGLDEWIQRYGRGSPTHIAELLNHAVEEGALRLEADGPHLDNDLPLPPGELRDLITLRINRLASESKTLLKTLALSNESMSPTTLFGLVPGTASAVDDLMARGHVRTSLRRSVKVFEPASSVHRAAALAALTSQELASLHKKMARALEGRGEPGALYERATHLKATNADDVSSVLESAATAFAQQGQRTIGARLFEEAATLEPSSAPRRARDWGRAASLWSAMGAPRASVARVAEQAKRAAQSGGADPESVNEAAVGYVRAVRLDGNLDAANEWLDSVASLGSAAESLLYAERAELAEAAGHLSAAAEAYQIALDTVAGCNVAAMHGEYDLPARLKTRLGSCLATGDAARARRELEEAIALAQRSGDDRARSRAFSSLAILHQSGPNWDAAASAFESAVAAAEDGGSPALALRTQLQLAAALAASGDVDGARVQCRVVLDRSRTLELKGLVQQALAQLEKLGDRAL